MKLKIPIQDKSQEDICFGILGIFLKKKTQNKIKIVYTKWIINLMKWVVIVKDLFLIILIKDQFLV